MSNPDVTPARPRPTTEWGVFHQASFKEAIRVKARSGFGCQPADAEAYYNRVLLGIWNKHRAVIDRDGMKAELPIYAPHAYALRGVRREHLRSIKLRRRTDALSDAVLADTPARTRTPEEIVITKEEIDRALAIDDETVRIRYLRHRGDMLKQIAAVTGLSVPTVHRRCGPHTGGSPR